MELTYVKKSKKQRDNMWFLNLSWQEGIALATSLLNQIESKNSNFRRLESYTKDRKTYVSIAVRLDETEMQLNKQIQELKEQLNNRSLSSWSMVPKEDKKSNQKEPKNGKQ